MASLTKSRTLFGVTSPRTIEKIIPEIALLIREFGGKKWAGNAELQGAFFKALSASEFYEDATPASDPAFSARERITRAPKALGFVDLEPTLQLTAAGNELLSTSRPFDIITKQLLKFQLPSPYHTQSTEQKFYVKPYLELLRAVNELGSLSKIEIAFFFLQITHINKFDMVINKIIKFREGKKSFSGSYRMYVDLASRNEILEIFDAEIKAGKLKTRETPESTLAGFVSTKRSNMLDYADAMMRYIRATQLVTVDPKTYRLVIGNTRREELDYILSEVPREPYTFVNKQEFKQYLFSATNLPLLDDDIDRLVGKLESLGVVPAANLKINKLKDLLEKSEKEIVHRKVEETKQQLRTYSEYNEIMDVFKQINNKEVPDAPLWLEWNVWRSLVMLNFAKRVHGNFVVDLDGMPLNTAGAKKPDIEVDYEDFSMIVEVTTSTGQKQYDMEGEPVARHYGRAKDDLNQNLYCIFIAPKISDGTLGHYFNLNRMNTKYYGGKTRIIPMTIVEFTQFIQAGRDGNFSDPKKLETYLKSICDFNQHCSGEDEWYQKIKEDLLKWAS